MGRGLFYKGDTMNGTVTVYFNTGFNGIDIPADPSVLELAPKKVYPDVYYIREDLDKSFINIKDTYDNLCNVDYCKIETTSRTAFFYAVPSALAQGVTQLALDLDGLLTMGGAANVNYSSGWQERGHITKQEDVLFENIASEAWTPSNPLQVVHLKEIKSTKVAEEGQSTDDYEIILSNIALVEPAGQTHPLGDGTDTQQVIQGIASGETDPAMYWPMIKVPIDGEETAFILWDNTMQTPYHNYEITGMAAYNYKNAYVKNAVEKLFSAGQLQLQSSYKLPWEYVFDGEASQGRTSENYAGHYARICGWHQVTTENLLPFVYEGDNHYTVKNKKCLETYRQFVIVNLASGDMSSKAPHEIYDGHSAAPTVKIWADPSSTGKPYARFNYIKDNPLQWTDCVKGLQWNNNMLAMEGASGSMWNSINAAFNSQNIQRSLQQNDLDSQYSTRLNALGQQAANLNFGYEAGNLGVDKAKLGVSGLGLLASSMTIPGMTGKTAAATAAKQNAAMGGAFSDAGNLGIGIVNNLRSVEQLNAMYQNDYQQRALQNEQNARNSALQSTRLRQQLNENAVDLYRNNQIVAPTIMFTPEQNLGLYGYNKFAIYEVRKSDADLKSEDMYYQRFGYSGLHRPLTAASFNAREYYSYVQAFNVNIKSDFGMRIRNKAIAQLNQGVRVWKVLPDASYYETN